MSSAAPSQAESQPQGDDNPANSGGRKIIDGRWEVHKHKLGEGNYGKVYLGTELSTGRTVAVKVTNMRPLGKELLERLQKEIEILQQIDHPHIVRFYDQLQSERYQLLMLEHMKGKDLHQYIRRQRLPLPITKRLFAHLTEGMRELFRRSIIHRDLKPQNLLLSSSDLTVAVLKIADFGFARFLDGPGGDMAKTVAGSPLYMAPEVLEAAVTPHRRGYTAAADLYSIGVILYQLVAGQAPFTATTQVELLRKMHAKRRDMLRRPRDADPAEFAHCSELVDRLLEPNPDHRCSPEDFVRSAWVECCYAHERSQQRFFAIVAIATAGALSAAASTAAGAILLSGSGSGGSGDPERSRTTSGGTPPLYDEDDLLLLDSAEQRERAMREVREMLDAARMVQGLCGSGIVESDPPHRVGSGELGHPAGLSDGARVACLLLKAMRLVAIAWRTLHRARPPAVAPVDMEKWKVVRRDCEALFSGYDRAAQHMLSMLHPDCEVPSSDELIFDEARRRARAGSVHEINGLRDVAHEQYRSAELLMRIVAQGTTCDPGTLPPQRRVAARCAEMIAKRAAHTAPDPVARPSPPGGRGQPPRPGAYE